MATKKKTAKKATKKTAPTKTKLAAKSAKKPAAKPAKKGAAAKTAKKGTAAKKQPAKKGSAAGKMKGKPAKKTAKKPAVAAKPAKKAAKRPATKKAPASPPVHRRDATGHLDPEYAAMLREKSLESEVKDEDKAFIGRSGHSKDDLAEEMGEAFVATATAGEDENEEVFNQEVAEEAGGPFVQTTGGTEFAEGTDESNPKGADKEPFPTT